MKSYEVIGLMSGTSLDGLDIACARFENNGGWHFRLLSCSSLNYNHAWRSKLGSAISLNGLDLKKLDQEYGSFLGRETRAFIDKHDLNPDLIVSHGHTVFHQPEIGLTMQIGDGYKILQATGIRTICDLRSMDVSLGGQGAPLVPLGDQLLFSDYDYCLNLGGFSNISFQSEGSRVAFDICPVNTVLNHLAAQLGLDFDPDGAIAKSGKLMPELLEKLNDLEYYKLNPPKSLGIEWVNQNILKILPDGHNWDILHTFCHHISDQIAAACSMFKPENSHPPSLLATGGGTKNSFLMELIREKLGEKAKVVVPDIEIVDFKEAIIFAFLGLLKELGQINCLKSVTGAQKDSSGGLVFDNNSF